MPRPPGIRREKGNARYSAREEKLDKKPITHPVNALLMRPKRFALEDSRMAMAYLIKALTEGCQKWIETNLQYETLFAGVPVDFHLLGNILKAMDIGGFELGKDFDLARHRYGSDRQTDPHAT